MSELMPPVEELQPVPANELWSATLLIGQIYKVQVPGRPEMLNVADCVPEDEGFAFAMRSADKEKVERFRGMRDLIAAASRGAFRNAELYDEELIKAGDSEAVEPYVAQMVKLRQDECGHYAVRMNNILSSSLGHIGILLAEKGRPEQKYFANLVRIAVGTAVDEKHIRAIPVICGQNNEPGIVASTMNRLGLYYDFGK